MHASKPVLSQPVHHRPHADCRNKQAHACTHANQFSANQFTTDPKPPLHVRKPNTVVPFVQWGRTSTNPNHTLELKSPDAASSSRIHASVVPPLTPAHYSSGQEWEMAEQKMPQTPAVAPNTPSNTNQIAPKTSTTNKSPAGSGLLYVGIL